MSNEVLLLLLLVILIIAAAPRWSYSRRWGYGPDGALVVILLILILLYASGNLSL